MGEAGADIAQRIHIAQQPEDGHDAVIGEGGGDGCRGVVISTRCSNARSIIGAHREPGVFSLQKSVVHFGVLGIESLSELLQKRSAVSEFVQSGVAQDSIAIVFPCLSVNEVAIDGAIPIRISQVDPTSLEGFCGVDQQQRSP